MIHLFRAYSGDGLEINTPSLLYNYKNLIEAGERVSNAERKGYSAFKNGSLNIIVNILSSLHVDENIKSVSKAYSILKAQEKEYLVALGFTTDSNPAPTWNENRLYPGANMFVLMDRNNSPINPGYDHIVPLSINPTFNPLNVPQRCEGQSDHINVTLIDIKGMCIAFWRYLREQKRKGSEETKHQHALKFAGSYLMPEIIKHQINAWSIQVASRKLYSLVWEEHIGTSFAFNLIDIHEEILKSVKSIEERKLDFSEFINSYPMPTGGTISSTLVPAFKYKEYGHVSMALVLAYRELFTIIDSASAHKTKDSGLLKSSSRYVLSKLNAINAEKSLPDGNNKDISIYKKL